MSWALARVDDRLIHGQVVVAWGHRLRPARIVVVDDAAAASAWERDLLASAAPGVEVRVVGVIEAAAGWADEAARAGAAILLVRSLATALALVEAGATVGEFNVGGLHYAPGKDKVSEYVFLGEADRAAARALLARGVGLSMQDVPATRPEPLAARVPGLAPA
jgi:mannose/fructose/N-acetylgalactosamine-specific phosphotransferase system component IIB